MKVYVLFAPPIGSTTISAAIHRVNTATTTLPNTTIVVMTDTLGAMVIMRMHTGCQTKSTIAVNVIMAVTIICMNTPTNGSNVQSIHIGITVGSTSATVLPNAGYRASRKWTATPYWEHIRPISKKNLKYVLGSP